LQVVEHMNRRRFLEVAIVANLMTWLSGCMRRQDPQGTASGDFPPVNKTPEQWRELLERDRYDVLFRESTERPGSSPLNAEKRPGVFVCAACYLPLFDARDKFESGTGWPSFTQPIKEDHIGKKTDYKILAPRTEYHCARCGGHQGHVFTDGPPPRGQRWCNNGLALVFIPEGEALPELRT
jgi:peptide-methionine (R)-S-oxide reductase